MTKHSFVNSVPMHKMELHKMTKEIALRRQYAQYPNPNPKPELFGQTRPEPDPKSKSPTRQSLDGSSFRNSCYTDVKVMTRLTVTLQLYGCNITSIKVVMLLQDLDNGNDRCWANGWLHGQGLALEGRLKAHPGRYDYCSQRYSNRHPQWYRIINATIVSKHQSKL